MGDTMGGIERKSAVVFYMPWILFILFLLYPVFNILGICLGYTLVIYHAWLQSALIAAMLLVTAIIAFQQNIAWNTREQLVLNLLLPMLILLQIYLMTRDIGDSSLRSVLCILSGTVAIISMIRLFFHYRFCIPLKIVCGILSVIFMGIWLPIAFVLTCGSLFTLVFGEFGRTNVVKEVLSPDQNYVAEVVDVDQGALGGDTLVKVKAGKRLKQQIQKIEVPVLVGKLVPKETLLEEIVYEGPWGKFETMVIKWKDNQTLVIDGKEYSMDRDGF